MKKMWIVAGLLAGFILGTTGLEIVAAQDKVPPTIADEQGTIGDPGRCLKSDSGEYPICDIVINSLAQKMEMSAVDLKARLSNGETLRSIARGKGLGIEDFETMRVDIFKQAVEQAESQGIISQNISYSLNQRLDNNRAIHDLLHQLQAEKMGINLNEYLQRINDGETFKNIANQNSIGDTDFAAMVKDIRLLLVDKAVTQGVLSQERADQIKGLVENAPELRGMVGDSIASALGLDADTLKERLLNGDKLKDIAAEKGIDEEKLATILQESRGQAIDKALSAGLLTQKQAERMTARLNKGGKPFFRFGRFFNN